MLAGPLFSREVLIAPRQAKHFIMRSAYIAGLFVLMYTAGQITFGWQAVRTVGSVSRFGMFVFQVFALVQLTLVMAFSLLAAAGSVAQEKDRRTLVLLLMTDLRDRELVGGKLLASLLSVIVLIVASIPVFFMVSMLGGSTVQQILWVQAVCALAGLAAGSWGALVAFWREKTFQTLALGALGIVLSIGVIEGVIAAVGPDSPLAVIGVLNPYRILLGSILNPLESATAGGLETAVAASLIGLAALSAGLMILTTIMVRRWNPSKSVYQDAAEDSASTSTRARTRVIWNSPLIWREIRTRAYGRKIFLIKLAYLILTAFVVQFLRQSAGSDTMVLGMISAPGFAFVALTLVGLMLVNAQAVTSVTSERDGQTLELLLVTDVTAKEFVFSKLGGVFYNTKEVILVPLLLVLWYAVQGNVTVENTIYAVLGYLAVVFFAAMLGLHAAFSYESSRTAIANSLGTMFFLFIGIFICMMLMVEAQASFSLQFPPFLMFILGGSLGLYASLTARNPSSALALAAGILPFCTFYAITAFLLGESLSVSLMVVSAYGFPTIAMLVPAVSEFDVALGRATLDKG
ncbi:MAG: ABC transporter permease [Planctomycetaceae bacterium]|nr:ABC transporter permease [Planctomycetaceae bacterium]